MHQGAAATEMTSLMSRTSGRGDGSCTRRCARRRSCSEFGREIVASPVAHHVPVELTGIGSGNAARALERRRGGRFGHPFIAAEDTGFEPVRVLPQHDFQSCALGHYANPPPRILRCPAFVLRIHAPVQAGRQRRPGGVLGRAATRVCRSPRPGAHCRRSTAAGGVGWVSTPRVASPCEPPQGRKAARINGL